MEKNFRSRLILSADDFTISPAANENILRLIRAGKIDRVGFMVNGIYSQKEVAAISQSGVKVDIHLNSTEKIFPRLFEKRSIISRSFKFLSHFVSGKTSAPVIEMEWEKQIEKFKHIFGRVPDGINTHEHIHFLPVYFKVVLRLAKKYEIPYLRFGKIGLLKCRGNIFRFLNFLHKKNASVFAASLAESSDYLASLDWISRPDYFFQQLPRGKTELICHPERKEELEIMEKYF